MHASVYIKQFCLISVEWNILTIKYQILLALEWSLYIASYVLFKNKLFTSVSSLLQLIRCAQKIVSRCSEVYSSDWFVRSQSRGCGREVACHRSSVVWAPTRVTKPTLTAAATTTVKQYNNTEMMTTNDILFHHTTYNHIQLHTYTYIYICVLFLLYIHALQYKYTCMD